MIQNDDKSMATNEESEFEIKVTRVKTLRTSVRGGAAGPTFLVLCTGGSRPVSIVTCLNDSGD